MQNDQNDQNDVEEQLLKQRIVSNNITFKSAFKATLGFYAAQFVSTLLGLVTITTVVVLGTLLYKLLK